MKHVKAREALMVAQEAVVAATRFLLAAALCAPLLAQAVTLPAERARYSRHPFVKGAFQKPLTPEDVQTMLASIAT